VAQFPTNLHGTFDEVAPGVRLAFLVLPLLPACFGYTPARNFMTDDTRLFHGGIAVLLTP
jgi:hypothetical protein